MNVTDDSTEFMSMLMDIGILHDYADEYGEPGYAAQAGVMIGDWWCRDKDCDYTGLDNRGEKALHDVAAHYPQLVEMAKNGWEFEWYDEWVVDHENSKAYRLQGDSYSWQPSTMFTEDGELLTPDDPLEVWIAEVVNNPQRCLPGRVWNAADLEGEGFTPYQCGYESGWHPGQTDNPTEISQLITDEYASKGKQVDIVYLLSHTGQFDMGFCAYVKEV
jgi:hypothetical protein